MTTEFGAEPVPPTRSTKTNTLAIVSIVCGGLGLIFSFCCGLLGVPIDIAAIVCGGIALSQIAAKREQGRGMAIGGISLGVLGILLSIGMTVLGVAIQGMPGGNWRPGGVGPDAEQIDFDFGDGELGVPEPEFRDEPIAEPPPAP